MIAWFVSKMKGTILLREFSDLVAKLYMLTVCKCYITFKINTGVSSITITKLITYLAIARAEVTKNEAFGFI